jgi:carbamoyl-phosphate synthase large subunit
VETLGLAWVSNVQVRADVHGQPRLLEVNPRFPGTLPLTIAAGVDMPRICLAMALGGPAPVVAGFRDVAMVRYLDHRVLDVGEMEAVADRSLEALAAAS